MRSHTEEESDDTTTWKLSREEPITLLAKGQNYPNYLILRTNHLSLEAVEGWDLYVPTTCSQQPQDSAVYQELFSETNSSNRATFSYFPLLFLFSQFRDARDDTFCRPMPSKSWGIFRSAFAHELLPTCVRCRSQVE